MPNYLSESTWKASMESVRQLEKEELSQAKDGFICLSGRKTIRIVVTDNEAWGLINRELKWSISAPVERPDATIVLLRVDNVEDFFISVFGTDIGGSREFRTIFMEKGSGIVPKAQLNFEERTVHIADGDTYYLVTESYCPEEWIKKGHVAVQMLFRTLNTDPDACLVHGACVGLDGNGILMCARGNMGKSTLAVTAMLDGFEFVSEDYLVLEKDEAGGLFASPIYSIITLSPRMYNALYDRMDKARFVGISHFKGKYVFDFYGYSDRLRRHYPIKACLFPEIDSDAREPKVVPLTGLEKNRAITHIAHSTIFQMWSGGLKQEQKDSDTILKIINMVKGMAFFKIVLTPNIQANVDCLRSFITSKNQL
ncbi:MAG: hypothetical protein J5886_04380 [Bacteroidales bacterium]|nr:hypothetical protein [Bacteroidales bacterium]